MFFLLDSFVFFQDTFWTSHWENPSCSVLCCFGSEKKISPSQSIFLKLLPTGRERMKCKRLFNVFYVYSRGFRFLMSLETCHDRQRKAPWWAERLAANECIYHPQLIHLSIQPSGSILLSYLPNQYQKNRDVQIISSSLHNAGVCLSGKIRYSFIIP